MLGLSEGQTMLVLSGWRGSGSNIGHSVNIEFKKNHDSTFDIKIVNTGKGSERHSSVDFKRNEVKKTLVTSMAFANVPCSYIDLSTTTDSSEWISSLKRLFKEEEAKPDKEFYHLFVHLEPFRDIQKEKDVSHYFTPQRSGTCSVKSLLACLRDQFGSIKEYKRFKLEFKYSTLRDFRQEFLANASFVNKEDKKRKRKKR